MIDSSEKCKIYVSLLSNFRVCELLKSAVSILWQWCRFVFLFIGRELTTWPANNCLQIMVCSCSVSSNCVWLQIILCSCINETALFCFFASLLLENGRSLCFSKKFVKKHKLSDRTIKKKKLLNSSYHKISWFISVSHRSIVCRSWRLTTDKSWYFGQPRPKINC